MRIKQKKNVAASVRDRLLNISKDLKIDFNRTLLLYAQERFLYRLISSKYRENFFLKGGVLFYGVHQLKARPTKDIDFLVSNLKNDAKKFKIVISDIIKQDLKDGLIFDFSSLSLEEIAENTEYRGLRIKVATYLEKAKINLQLDMGFGDVIFPEPITFKYPSILDEKAFDINAYTWESVIAEKFEAIVKLSDLNSRMKDFYDVNFLMQNHDFAGKYLREAIARTFNNRGTNLKNYTYIFSNGFKDSKDKHIQWQAFIKKSRLDTEQKFNRIIDSLKNFIEPLVLTILEKNTFDEKWHRSSQKWTRK
jgi:hypothetical protein